MIKSILPYNSPGKMRSVYPHEASLDPKLSRVNTDEPCHIKSRFLSSLENNEAHIWYSQRHPALWPLRSWTSESNQSSYVWLCSSLEVKLWYKNIIYEEYFPFQKIFHRSLISEIHFTFTENILHMFERKMLNLGNSFIF